jgi:hypothetical protein
MLSLFRIKLDGLFYFSKYGDFAISKKNYDAQLMFGLAK